MANCAKQFQQYLDKKDYNYTVLANDSERVVIDFPYKGKSTKCFFTGKDYEYLSIYTIYESIPSEKRNDLILVCNDLNNRFKWVTFYVDNDNDLILHVDALLSLRTADEEAMEMLVRTLDIGETAKPTIMKAIYA